MTNNSWNWQSSTDLPYLTCSLLEEWQHGFFTQQFFPQTPEDLVNILDPDAKVYRVKQVHSNRIVMSSEFGTVDRTFPDGDGIIAEKPQESVWVASADCTPILVGDIKTKKVGAIHAGWRGTAKNIVKEAIVRFLATGSFLQNLRFAMGPAISGSVYQVEDTVAAEVGSSIISTINYDSISLILKILEDIPNPPILEDPEPGKVRLDVRRLIELQLSNLGVKPEHISIAPYCTYSCQDYFFSYRRTKEKKVQWSGIVSQHQN